jgi:hypothetical protein
MFSHIYYNVNYCPINFKFKFNLCMERKKIVLVSKSDEIP